jgi:hypothetical protein
MEVATMKKLLARRFALVALALALVWICSCSNDGSPTCPKPAACHDPSKAFLGTWIVFESTINGSPDQIFMGMQWDFINHDTIVVATNPNPYVWSVNDSVFFMMSTPDPSSEFYAFTYEFEADTLSLRSETGTPFTIYWRFHRAPSLPVRRLFARCAFH